VKVRVLFEFILRNQKNCRWRRSTVNVDKIWHAILFSIYWGGGKIPDFGTLGGFSQNDWGCYA